MNTRKVIAGLIALAVVVSAIVLAVTDKKTIPNVLVYISEQGEQVTITTNPDESILFESSVLGNHQLSSVVSASGAKYATRDESFVVWNKGNEVTVLVNEEIVFQGTRSSFESSEVSDYTTTDLKQQITIQSSWVWQSTVLADDTVIIPQNASTFTLNFDSAELRVQGTTDCNNFFGSFSINDNQISFGPLASTLMYCEDSQEQVFTGFLSQVTNASLTPDGVLTLLLGDTGAVMYFNPRD